MDLLIEIVALLLAVVILYVLYKFINQIIKLAMNSIAGIVILFLLNFVFGLGIPINIFTILITAFAGVGGVVLILILHFLGLAF